MVDWSTLPNNGTNGSESLSLQDIEDEFGGDGGDIEIDFYWNGGAYVPDVAWNYAIPDLYNSTGNIKTDAQKRDTPLSFNAFYGAVWGTFVNFQMVGGGGGGCKAGSRPR